MPLAITLDYDLGVPVYRQVFDAVVSALTAGRLQPDEQLPTIHGLARELDVNPNTIIRAYRELEHAGHIISERGRGTFPARQKAPKPSAHDQKLQTIWRHLVDDCAKQGITLAELRVFLKRELG